jgi:hypothetical protein
MPGLLTCLLYLPHECLQCECKNLSRNVASYLPANTARYTRTFLYSVYEDVGGNGV